jgi:hypothetical protein
MGEAQGTVSSGEDFQSFNERQFFGTLWQVGRLAICKNGEQENEERNPPFDNLHAVVLSVYFKKDICKNT